MLESTANVTNSAELAKIKYQERAWDIAGVIIGLLGCIAQLSQVLNEWFNESPSSLSIGFVLGYWLVFGFWLAYGLFFKRIAIIVTNSIALLLQSFLIIAVW